MAAAPPCETGRDEETVTLPAAEVVGASLAGAVVTGTMLEGRTGVPLETGHVVTVTVVSTEVRVQGQSVTVMVPGVETMMVLLFSVKVVASGQYVT